MAPYLGPAYDAAVRLKQIEDRLSRLESNPLGQAFSASQSDGSIGVQMFQDSTTGAIAFVIRQGTTTARDPNTGQHAMLAYLGEIFSGGSPDDSAVIFYRPTNTESMVAGNRGVQIFDAKGNQILASDEYGTSPSNEGLRNPQLPLPIPQPTGTNSWPKTTSTTLAEVAFSYFPAQHPKVWWVAQFTADPGTNGTVELQLTSPDGLTVVTGVSYTVTGGQFGSTNDTLTLPSGFWHQVWTVSVMAQVTSGSGNVYCDTLHLYGLA